MECRECGYKGPPKFEEFRGPEVPWAKQHIRCPQCGGAPRLITTRERVEKALRFPEYCMGPERPHDPVRMIVEISAKMFKEGLASYSIHCNYCQWGEGGGLDDDDYEYLRSILPEISR